MEDRTAWQKEYAFGSGKTPFFKKGQYLFVRGTQQLDIGAYGIVKVDGRKVIGQVIPGGLRIFRPTQSVWVDAPAVQFEVMAEVIGVQGENVRNE